MFHIFKIYLLKLHKKVLYRLDSAKYSFSNRLAGLNEWNDMSEEVIDNKILAVFKKNLTFVFR